MVFTYDKCPILIWFLNQPNTQQQWRKNKNFIAEGQKKAILI